MTVQTTLNAWANDVVGRYINEDYEPASQGYGAQCWDLAANWSKRLGLPVVNTGGPGRWPGWAGNMVDSFPQSPEVGAAYELIGPGEPALPGDIAVWGDTYFWYPKTHVAVVLKDAGDRLQCMSQNSTPSRADNPYPQWTTGPAAVQELPKQGLIGYLRPRAGQEAIAPQSTAIAPQGSTVTPIAQEDDMPLTPEEKKEIIDGIIWGKLPKYDSAGREIGTTTLGETVAWQEANFYLGRKLTLDAIKETVLGVLTSPVKNVATGGTTNLGTEISWLPENFKRTDSRLIDADALATSIATAVVNLTAEKA